jgi:hypothetical protein
VWLYFFSSLLDHIDISWAVRSKPLKLILANNEGYKDEYGI